MKDLSALRQELHDAILKEIDLSREVSDEEVEELISNAILSAGKRTYLSLEEKKSLMEDLFDSIRKKGVIQALLDDPSVTEIMVNGTDSIFVERAGRLFRWDKSFESKETLGDVIQQIAASSNRVVNEASPIVDARLDGCRVNIVMNPVALNGPVITIRRFPEKPVRMDDLIRFGSINTEAVDFLKKLVISGYNIFISGGTGSGKTRS